MENRRRNIQIKFRVTEDEKKLIEKKMAQIPTQQIGAYIRKMAIDGYIIYLDTDNIKEFTKELEHNGYGYALLSAISQNAIRVTRDIYMRPDVYKQIEDELRVLLADIIVEVQNGKDYNIAIREARIRIYKSADVSFNPDTDMVGDFRYWNVPPVDSAELYIARKLLMNVE